MASFGLAMVEGERNARDLALGRVSTIAGMAKAAKEGEMANEYFSPGASAMRAMLDSEQLEAVKNITETKDTIKNLTLDPERYAAGIIDKTLGKSADDSKWLVEPKADGTYVAREVPTDGVNQGEYRSINLGNKAQMVGTLAQNLTQTSLDRLKTAAALKQAADASDIKRGESYYNAVLENQLKTRPTLEAMLQKAASDNATKLRGHQIDAGASIQGHQIDAQAGIQKAYINIQPEQLNAINKWIKSDLAPVAKFDNDGNIIEWKGKPSESWTERDRLEANNAVTSRQQAAAMAVQAGIPIPGFTPEDAAAYKKSKSMPTTRPSHTPTGGVPAAKTSTSGGGGIPSRKLVEERERRTAERLAAQKRAAEMREYNKYRVE